MASATGSLAEAGSGGKREGCLFDPTATPTVAFRNCAGLFKAISRGSRPGERQPRWDHSLYSRPAGARVEGKKKKEKKKKEILSVPRRFIGGAVRENYYPNNSG